MNAISPIRNRPKLNDTAERVPAINLLPKPEQEHPEKWQDQEPSGAVTHGPQKQFLLHQCRNLAGFGSAIADKTMRGRSDRNFFF